MTTIAIKLPTVDHQAIGKVSVEIRMDHIARITVPGPPNNSKAHGEEKAMENN